MRIEEMLNYFPGSSVDAHIDTPVNTAVGGGRAALASG